MFERNRSETMEHGTVTARIVLADGEELTARLVIPAGRGVFDVLNGASAFVEVESFEGERSWLARAMLKSVKLVNAPRAMSMQQRTRELDGFEPYAVLGLDRNADFAKVKSAYHAQAMIYHPDRFAHHQLPDEVRCYLDAMARRINTAFAVLEAAENEKARRAARTPAGPRSEFGLARPNPVPAG